MELRSSALKCAALLALAVLVPSAGPPSDPSATTVDNAQLTGMSCGDAGLPVERLAVFGTRSVHAVDSPWFTTGTLRAGARTPGRADAWPLTVHVSDAQDADGTRGCR